MKRLALVLATIGLAAGSASSQSMAVAARKEKERQEKARQQGAATKVVTEDELHAGGGKLANDPSIAPAAPASDPGRTSRTVGIPGTTAASASRPASSSASAGSAPPRGGDEATWRSGISALRANVARLEKEVAALDGKANGLAYGVATDPGPLVIRGRPIYTELPQDRLAREASNAGKQQAWERERKDVLDRLEKARSALSKAKSDLAQYEESARRQGIPPGWLR
jgi:hypothetical protein